MKNHGVAAIGVNKAIFGTTAKARDARALHTLTQVNWDRPAQIGPTRFHMRQHLAIKDGGKTTNGRFNFGKFWHMIPLASLAGLG
jgi:hypothetical protein